MHVNVDYINIWQSIDSCIALESTKWDHETEIWPFVTDMKIGHIIYEHAEIAVEQISLQS